MRSTMGALPLACLACLALTQGAAAIDPANGGWTLILDQGAPGGGPLTIHLRARQGRITQAWALTAEDNRAGDVDASGLRLQAGALSGEAIVTRDNVRSRYTLDVKTQADPPAGSFGGVCGLTDVGDLAGSVGGSAARRVEADEPAAFDLRLGHGLPGMTGAISEVRLAFTLKGGRPSGDLTVESTTGRKPAPHWAGKVEHLEAAWDGRALKATVTVAVEPTSFLWHGGGTHVIALEAAQVGNYLHGACTTGKEGREVANGVVAGTVAAQAPGDFDPARAALALALDQAVDGREELLLYLGGRDGTFTGVAVAPRSPGMGRAHAVDASGLRLDAGRLKGPVRISIAPDAWGKGADRPLAAVLELDATTRDGAAGGTYKGRYVSPAVAGAAAARWQSWEALAAENALAPGRDFPRWRGPASNGSSAPCGRDLVESLADMRLVWRSEARLPNSWLWSADPIGGIVGGHCTPLVFEGRVYMFYYAPSGTYVVEGMPSAEGRDKDRWRDRFRVDADDVFLCLDGATGRTLWTRTFAEKGINFNKTAGAGPFMTACIEGGRLYGIGSAGRVYAVDARTGGVLWESDVGAAAAAAEAERQRCRRALEMPAMNRDFCSAPVVADGVVVCNDNAGGLVGLDAATGRRLWGPIPDCTVKTSSPVKWVHKGKEYVIVGGSRAVCVEPRSGRLLWEAKGAGAHGTIAVTEDAMVCAGVDRGPPGETPAAVGLSAYRIGLSGADLLWCLGEKFNNHVTSPVIYQGHVYGFSPRSTICVELASGRIVGEAEFPGTRTCSSLIAFDGRVLRENLYRRIYYHKADPKDFRLLGGGPWTAPSQAENTTSTVADGRLFMRGKDCLYCYDLRKPAAK